MKKLIFTLFAATLGTAAFAQQPTTVLVVNINGQMVSFLHNAVGFNLVNPYAEVLILNPSPAADGYRIHVTYTDPAGVQHDVLRDSISQPTSDGRATLEVFSVDAATISVTVTPYKLQVGSIASTP
jgi:hypothetical protein